MGKETITKVFKITMGL